MEKDERQSGGPAQGADSRESQRASRPAPGKVTRTSRLASSRGPAAQRKAAAAGPGAGGAQARSARDLTMDSWMDAAHRGVTALAQDDRGVAPVQAKAAQSAPGAAASRAGQGGGAAMPDAVRGKMESAFGVDLAPVRIHEGSHVQAAGALAYTQGTDIHFAPGQYQPTSQRGQELLGHELTHVVQQAQGRVQGTTQAAGLGVNDDAGLEREADQMGAAAARGERVSPGGGSIAVEGASASAGPQASEQPGLQALSSAVIQRKPTTSQAGTVAQFIEVFNNTPSGMGRTSGQEAHSAMLRLGDTELTLSGPLPTTTPYFNQRPARYVYTTQGGWIDMVHFLFHAGRAYKHLIAQRDAARSLEEIQAMPWYQRMWLPPEYLQALHRQSSISPIGESVQEGFQTERMQQVMTPRSAFSYEDIPSDTFGARFAVQHFNPNARTTLGEQLAAYLTNVLGAVEPTQAPNYSQMPAEDDGTVDRQNFTTTPVYTGANP